MSFRNTIKQTFTDPAYLAARQRFWTRRPLICMDETYCAWCDGIFERRVNVPTPARYCSDRCYRAAKNERRRVA